MAGIKHGGLSTNAIVNGVLWDGWKWTPTTTSASTVEIRYKFEQGQIGGAPSKSWTSAEKATYWLKSDG